MTNESGLNNIICAATESAWMAHGYFYVKEIGDGLLFIHFASTYLRISSDISLNRSSFSTDFSKVEFCP